MCLGWENNIEDLNLVEKTLGELMTNIFSKIAMSVEEKNFVLI